MSEQRSSGEVLRWFEAISRIPRRSGDEARVRAWLQGWAAERGLGHRADAAGNLVIEVPATSGYEDAPGVILQGHMDMVCEKAKGSGHDFSQDPIRLVTDGDWLRADMTTLGADNGIGIALGLAVADAGDVEHPPLELLFTVDEETGLTGARALEPGFVRGRVLLNLDSEDEGVLTVGCAGGQSTQIRMAPAQGAVPREHVALRVTVGGLSGGHSGVDIHDQRANAIQALARALQALGGLGDLRLAAADGGTAHNAIPRDAEALVWLPGEASDAAHRAIAALEAALRVEYARTDPALAVSVTDAADASAMALTAADTRRLTDLLLALPHGVDRRSPEIEGLVETSNNLATLTVRDGDARILTSQRSSSMARLRLLTDRITATARLAGADAESTAGYPAWTPNMDSPLLARCRALYEQLFGKPPVVEVIHAGLECGIIGARSPGLDMISFGPTIQNPHSPAERLHLPSVAPVYTLLCALLGSLRR